MSEPEESGGGPAVYNRQTVFSISPELHRRLTEWAQQAWRLTADHALVSIDLEPEEIEVTLIDDPTIARIHLEFMQVPGATDVITFEHGEILISLETAERQATKFGDTFEREILRYIVHGMLHLAGHDDADPEQRAAMEAAQEAIVDAIHPREKSHSPE